jgi:hypothetical protein
MYRSQDLLHQIDAHTAPILIGFALAMVCQTIGMVDAVRVSRRERVISIPLFCTFFWFAHDVGTVVRFHDWFSVYDHWFMKLYWVGLLSAMLLEFVFFAQAVRYGREELLPQVSERAFAALLLAGVIGTNIAWEYLKAVMSDPLYQASPALTLLALPITGAALMIRRRSAAGQTVVIWASFTALSCFWWATTVGFYTSFFRSWEYISAGVFTIAACAAMTVVVARLKPAEEAAAAAARRGTTTATGRAGTSDATTAVGVPA